MQVAAHRSYIPLSGARTKTEEPRSLFAAPNDLGELRLLSDLKVLKYSYGDAVKDFLSNLPQSLNTQNEEKLYFPAIRKALTQYNPYLANMSSRSEISRKYNEWLNKKNHPHPKDTPPERIFKTIADEKPIQIYWSREGNRSRKHNRVAVDAKNSQIVCRHLAFWYLCHDKDYHAPMSQLKSGKVPRLKSLTENYFDSKRINFVSNSSAMFKLDNLGEALYNECKGMKAGGKKKFMFYTENHAMSIIVHKKLDTHIILKFYDPNKTEVSLRANLTSLDDLKRFTTKNFISPAELAGYFPRFKIASLSCIDTDNMPQTHEQEISVDVDVKPQDGLFMALQKGYKDTVDVFIKAVLADKDLTPEQKTEILLAKMADGTSGLFMALHNGHKDAVENFIKAILANKVLTPEQKTEILSAKNANGISGLFVALQNGYKDMVEVFIKAVLADKVLTPEQKTKILLAKRDNGAPGLFVAFQNGHKDTVEIFIKAVLADKVLTPEQKTKILLAKRDNGTHGLFMALDYGHKDTVEVFIKAVLADEGLNSEQKYEILLAKRANGTPGLFVAFQNGHKDTVEVFIKAVLADKGLTFQQKKGLIKSEDFKIIKQYSIEILVAYLEGGANHEIKTIWDYIINDNTHSTSGLSENIKHQLDFLLEHRNNSSSTKLTESATLMLLICEIISQKKLNGTTFQINIKNLLAAIQKEAKTSNKTISNPLWFEPKIEQGKFLFGGYTATLKCLSAA